MATVPTVKIEDDRFERGFRIINEEDYDEEEHALHGEKEPGALPPDFPGRSALIEDGRYATIQDVQDATDDDLDAVDGIGPATIEDIRAY